MFRQLAVLEEREIYKLFNISNLASTILSYYKSGNLPFAMTFFKNRFAINHQVEQTYY